MHPQEAHDQATEELRKAMEKIRHDPFGSVTLTLTKRNGQFEYIDTTLTTKKQLSSGT